MTPRPASRTSSRSCDPRTGGGHCWRQLLEFAGHETSAEEHVLLAVQYGDVGAALASLSPGLAFGLTIELLAALVVVWTAAAWGGRRGFDEPGLVTAPVLVGLLFVGAVPPQAPLLVSPGPQWLAAHLWWAAVLASGVVLLAAGMRDAAARWGRGHLARPQAG